MGKNKNKKSKSQKKDQSKEIDNLSKNEPKESNNKIEVSSEGTKNSNKETKKNTTDKTQENETTNTESQGDNQHTQEPGKIEEKKNFTDKLKDNLAKLKKDAIVIDSEWSYLDHIETILQTSISNDVTLLNIYKDDIERWNKLYKYFVYRKHDFDEYIKNSDFENGLSSIFNGSNVKNIEKLFQIIKMLYWHFPIDVEKQVNQNYIEKEKLIKQYNINILYLEKYLCKELKTGNTEKKLEEEIDNFLDAMSSYEEQDKLSEITDKQNSLIEKITEYKENKKNIKLYEIEKSILKDIIDYNKKYLQNAITEGIAFLDVNEYDKEYRKAKWWFRIALLIAAFLALIAILLIIKNVRTDIYEKAQSTNLLGIETYYINQIGLSNLIKRSVIAMSFLTICILSINQASRMRKEMLNISKAIQYQKYLKGLLLFKNKIDYNRNTNEDINKIVDSMVTNTLDMQKEYSDKYEQSLPNDLLEEVGKSVADKAMNIIEAKLNELTILKNTSDKKEDKK
ncbi:MAG: hypothetical protein MJ211_14170 [Bacteroidales bacterium]|nr:hypothetical protein [Bacteroidales bacterium]